MILRNRFVVIRGCHYGRLLFSHQSRNRKEYFSSLSNGRSAAQQSKEQQLEAHRKALMGKNLPQKKPIEGVKKVILVASGKGGVGKSTVATNLAVSLKLLHPSKEISLLDADVFGPSIPRMMNLSGEPDLNSDETFFESVPAIETREIIDFRQSQWKCMSMGFLVKESDPIVWRGLMVMAAIEKLVRRVQWGPSDILVVDMPPGTGDTQLSFAQTVVVDGAVIVTTPQKVAVQDALKGAAMFAKVNVPLLGFVLNMSSYSCANCGTLTKSKYAQEFPDVVNRHNSILLGEIPFGIDVSDSSDDGRPVVLEKADSAQAKEFKKIAEAVHINLHKDSD